MRLSVTRNNISAQEAYEIIHKKYPTEKVRNCLEYDKFYLFSLAPLYVNDNESYSPGTEFDAVDKITGKVFDYDITTNIDAYKRAKNVPVNTFYDTPVSKL